MPKRPYRPYRNTDHLIRIYRFIEEYDRQYKCSPSYTDIVKNGLAPSTSVVRFYFDHMEKLGMITYQQGVARSCRVVPTAEIPYLMIRQALQATEKEAGL